MIEELEQKIEWAEQTALAYSVADDRYGAGWYTSRALAFKEALRIIRAAS